MKIRLLVGFEGPTVSLAAGSETSDFSESDARSLIAAGYAVPVEVRATEKATKRPAAEKR